MASIQKYVNRESDAEKLRTSQKRRNYLEKLACMHSGKEVYVQISGEDAYADIAKRKDRLGYTDRLIINVPAQTPNQAATNYDRETWDLLFQKTEMYHELGHVLYTDWPSFENVLFGDGQQWGVEKENRPMFRDWWNILEDATIESDKFLAKRFNIKNDLRVKNENLLKQNRPTHTFKSLHEAVSSALMEYKHPIGWIDTLLDEHNDEFQFLTEGDRDIFVSEIKPIIDDRAPEIIAEGDPVERNIKVYEMYEEIKPHLDTADSPGTNERLTFGFPDDGEERGDGSGGKEVETGGEEIPGKPTEGHDDYLDIDMQQEYSDELKQEKNAIENQKSRDDSIEKWGRLISYEYDTDSDMEIVIPDDPPTNGSYNDATKIEAERLSKPLAKELQQRLHHAQQTKKVSGQKSGKVQAKAVHKTQQGKTNIFTRTQDPEDKDYSCIIIVDRSGSMSRSGMSEVETAAGALAFALEDVGVDVGQLSLYKSTVYLEKAIDEDVEQARRRLFRGVKAGGTPLSDALALARERLEDIGGHPFVIVVTDGEPDHRERYRDILHSVNFPVLGIYVGSNMDGFNEEHTNEAAYFHALEYRGYNDVLDGARNLVKQVMF